MRTPSQFGHKVGSGWGFVCGKRLDDEQDYRLGASNGVTERLYNFKVRSLTEDTEKVSYQQGMIKECAKVGMKPTCDDAGCKGDSRVVYLGNKKGFGLQSYYKRNRNPSSYVLPSRIPSLCTRSTRAGIEWCCCHRAVCMARPR